jgi:hypothetical protein
MLKPLLILVAGLALLAGPASAADEKPAKAVGQYVDLQPVALPIVVKGVLLNYVFVYVRVNLTGGADVQKLREKEPYFRDALVRDAHRAPFVLASDFEKIDDKRLIATMMRDAVAIAGPGVVQSITLVSQTPQHRVRMPAPGPATS